MKKRTKFWPEIIGVLLGLAIVHIPLIFSKVYWGHDWGNDFDPAKAGVFGDFIGGYVGTVILVISVGFLSASFRNQTSTNDRTAFESRFFELLKFHRENVSEIEIGTEKKGRRVFVSLILEFREALKIVDHDCQNIAPDYSRPLRLDLAYLALYYGVGRDSTPILRAAVRHHPEPLVHAVIQTMETKRSSCRELDEKLSNPEMPGYEREANDKRRRSITGVSYCPFDGHQSRLGHYYRHLYQLVKYIKGHAPKGTSAEYADIVRAQLTNHEQALLCLNALSTIGAPWITDEYLTKFSIIQNIPEFFFDPLKELNLKKTFPGITFEFEKGIESPAEPNRASTTAAFEE